MSSPLSTLEEAGDDDDDEEEEEECEEDDEGRAITKKTLRRLQRLVVSNPQRDPNSGQQYRKPQQVFHSFEQAHQELETGDLVLLSNNSWQSCIVRWFTGSEWTHAGVVVRERRDRYDQLWMLESMNHPDGPVDVLTGTQKEGVRLVSLAEAVQSAELRHMAFVRIAWPSVDCFSDAERALWEFMRTEHTKPYEHSYLTFIRLVLDLRVLGHNQIDTREYFCSELVAEAYKHMGLLATDFNSSDCTPDIFFDYMLPLKRGAIVHEIKYVAKPRKRK